nr:Conjugative transfer protein TrbN [Salmonella enterica subsp. enterica serovar Rissen]
MAAWRIRGHIKNDKGDIWTKAANYHSKTPQFNEVYRADLIRKAAKWQTWIEARFNTFDATKPAGTTPQPQLAAAGVTPEERAGKALRRLLTLHKATHTLQNRQRMTGQQQHHLRRINLLVLPLL